MLESAILRAPVSASAIALAASLCLAPMPASAEYVPPKLVPPDELVAATKEIMSRPSIPTTGKDGWVEDVFRVKAGGMDWDIGTAVYTPSDPSKVAVGAD